MLLSASLGVFQGCSSETRPTVPAQVGQEDPRASMGNPVWGARSWSTPLDRVTPTAVPVVRGNPFADAAPFLDEYTSVADAAHAVTGPRADVQLLERLAEVPTASWLLPEAYPVGAVGAHVESLVFSAQKQGTIAVFVVYGVPGRDCIDSHSSGGTTAADYPTWIREISDAAGHGSVVILEPDALASLGSCSGDEERVTLLRDAVEVLSQGPVTYVDAGHSRWQSSATMISRLRQVGVEKVRGFALNVANYGAESAERAYGSAVSQALGGSHFVVDTGRAGGAGPGRGWCNPAGQAVGALPGRVDDGSAMDARLWVKPPGESDGECGGGPAAGQFWAERALELVRAAGW